MYECMILAEGRQEHKSVKVGSIRPHKLVANSFPLAKEHRKERGRGLEKGEKHRTRTSK